MLVRLGYVSLSKTLDSSFRTMQYTNYKNNQDKDIKLDSVIKENLHILEQIIEYNYKNNVHFYRITSDLIPLASLESVNYEYINKYKNIYDIIGKKINNYGIRVDMHPNEYTVLASTKENVIKNSVEELKYHKSILDALHIENKILILHVGSSVFGKDKSIERFIKHFNDLPDDIKNIIAVENDDKIYNVDDVLTLCKKIKVPMILDYHHHICNPSKEIIIYYLKDIFSTWGNKIPKVHFSSPKNKTKKDFRTHNDYINVDEFIAFLELIKPYINNIDIMLEAKMKDEALFRLERELKYKTNYRFIDDTTFEIK